MLVLAILLAACAGARAQAFNITYLYVPHIVTPEQQEVEFECRYNANFTVLSWFKGANEFFRYRPDATPSIRSFPIFGIGRVEMITCGPVACQLKLGGLTEEATGQYRCDIEFDVPPYMYSGMTAYMKVLQRSPLIEGLAEEYKEDDMIQAHCRAAPESVLSWYINGVELEEFRGSTNLKKKNYRFFYMGEPLTMVVQCIEFRQGKIHGSTSRKAKWNDGGDMQKKKENDVTNGSIVITGRLGLLSILCLLDKVLYV